MGRDTEALSDVPRGAGVWDGYGHQVDAVNLVKFLEDNDGFRETMLRLDDESHMIKPADPRCAD